MTKGGFFAAGVSAGAALVVLAFAGVVMLMLFAIYAGIAAIIAVLPVMYLESRYNWSITYNSIGFIPAFLLAFVISGGVAFALDLIFKTYFSVPGMIAALEVTHWVAARPVKLIESVPDYYAFALGPTPGTWLRFVGFHIAIVLVFAGVLIRMPAEAELEPDPPMKRNLQLLGLSALAVASSAVTLFPLTTWAMIALRNRTH